MDDDKGVTAVLGAVMMMALMMTLIPGALLMRGAIADEMDAQRVAAERAAWCARNPSVGPPSCRDAGPLPGYRCDEVELDAWICRPVATKGEPDTRERAPPQEEATEAPMDPPGVPGAPGASIPPHPAALPVGL